MSNSIYNRLLAKEAKLAVIGLGYVGLPIALEFARKVSVIGYDINAKRIHTDAEMCLLKKRASVWSG